MPDVKLKQRPVLPDWEPYPYTIVPMLVLKAGPLSKGIFSYLHYYDETFTSWTGFICIKGVDGYNVLVDTGPTEEDCLRKGMPCEVVQSAPDALKASTGLNPDDIDNIIIPHLHHHPCPLSHLYKNAKFIIQEDEWHAVHNPPVCYRHLYHPEYVDSVVPTLVNGDVFNVLPGIHLLYTPGHTPGSQSVAVDTEVGRAIICGFCCSNETLYPPEELRSFWPDALVPGLHVNTEDAYESVLRVKNEADYIIQPHVKETYTSDNFPGAKWARNTNKHNLTVSKTQ
jgi:glyoxylase-like metal-dependent hydrolase (beta-lactamase superfamily II)